MKRPMRPSVLALIGLCLVFGSALGGSTRVPVNDEQLLKTAYIFNFAKFTRWPGVAWTDDRTALSVCAVGTDELAQALHLLGRETVRGREVNVKQVDTADAVAACHILYIAASEYARFRQVLNQAASGHALTISEIRGFADQGGMIQLFRDKSRIRFKINTGAIERRGLRLSARLLDLAEIVHSGVSP